MIDTATNSLRVANSQGLNFELYPAHVITVRATDAAGTFYDASFSITIIDINDAPIAVADQYITTQLNDLQATAANGVLTNDRDEDGSPLSVIVVKASPDGTLTMSADGTFSYMPTGVFSGSDSFTYLVTDGQLNSSIVTVTVNVMQTISTGLGGNSGNTGSTGSGNTGTTGGTGTTTGTSTGNSSASGSTTNNGDSSGSNNSDSESGNSENNVPASFASNAGTQQQREVDP